MSHPARVAILSLESHGSACDSIRLMAPLGACPELVSVQRALEVRGTHAVLRSEVTRWAELIVVQRFLPNPQSAPLLEELLALGVPIVYETDDLLTEITDRNPNRALCAKSGPHIVALMQRAAAVIVSTPPLADYLADLNPSLHVLPNLVDTRLFHRVPKRSKDHVDVLFAGTGTHMEDLELVEPALQQLQSELGPRVRYTFMGCVTPSLSSLPGVRLIELEPSYAAYAEILRGLDVDLAIVPLRDHRFNRCKSDIKWLEYSACGIPGVYSAIEPYVRSIEHGRTGWLVPDDTRAWTDTLREAITESAARARISTAAHDAVRSTRTLELGAHVYAELYTGLAKRPGIATRRPDCSIVIPVFNRVDCTRRCLEALLEMDLGPHVEVIVVDDGSSDGTAEYLASLGGGVRTLHQPTNRGFAAACNAGAAIARAPLLLFLNNDTQPERGWLEPLLDEMARAQDVAIVGAKLVYPDRRIQHAGIAFSVPDGVPYNLFRGAPESFPPACEAREYAAVTGACMLVRRRIFRSLGGFDERYRNGFEDVDLCLRARQRGVRIVYQPASCVVHLEEQSPGRKAHDGPNLQRFLERWGHPALSDEMAILLDSGLAVRSLEARSSEARVRRLAPIRDPGEWQRWSESARVSRALRSCDWESLEAGPPDAAQWPDDPDMLLWGERVCRHLGLIAAADAFAARSKAIRVAR